MGMNRIWEREEIFNLRENFGIATSKIPFRSENMGVGY
jgi:hypothetical protein